MRHRENGPASKPAVALSSVRENQAFGMRPD
jgi:hypothetical protein